MSRVNLLYVITKLELGGAQKHLFSLIDGLPKEKYNLFLFTAQDGLLLAEFASRNGLTIKKSKFLERPINLLKDFLSLIEISSFIRKNNITIVHTHSSKAGILGRIAAKLSKVKIIIHTVHGWSFNDFQPVFIRKLYIWIERFTSRFTDKIIVVSGYDKQKGLINHIGRDDKYRVIHYGISYEEYITSIADSDVKKELGIGEKDLVIGTISCLKPQKYPQDFIRAAFMVNKIMPNTKFILIGDGVLFKTVSKMIKKFNLQKNVILTGWRKDVDRILSAIDIFILTSLWEGMPISVIEAMLMSKPVVATDTGGIREIVIEGYSGFLTCPRDIKNISEKIIALIKNEELRKRIGRNGKASLGETFRFKNMLSNTESLYDSLLKNNLLHAN